MPSRAQRERSDRRRRFCPARSSRSLGSSLQRNDAGVWLCEYPGLSFQRSPVCACSLVSSLLLSGATMSQQSSLTQSAHSVRQVLTAYSRQFGKLLAGGAAPLALQSAWNYRAAGQSLRNNLKDISGELNFNDAVLQEVADDFGHVVHKKPAAMLRPSDAQDIAKLVQFANRQGVKVAMRGQGHSFFGQTQVADGVVIDSRSLNAIRIVKSGTGGTAEIGSGSKWHPVLMAANAQKLTVPVIVDTFLSVGGTISTGGFGVTTYNLGLQVDHVQELEVVTGEGQIVTCSDKSNSALFNAMLGGMGQCGIITKVVIRLVTAPTNVLFIKMDYDDFQSASADLALLAKEGRFHHLDGRGAGRPPGGVGY